MARGSQESKRTSRKNEETGRNTILDAAERLFAERGVEAVSLRTINAEAGFSVAALHYHFATRDGLIRALLARAQPPMLEHRARLVTGLRALDDPPLEAVVEALVLPLTAGLLDPRGAGANRLRFLARLYFDRSPYMAGILDESLELFLPLLRRALPALDDRTLTQRWAFASELAARALANAQELRQSTGHRGKLGPAGLERFVRELVSFIAGGLHAPHRVVSDRAAPPMTGALVSQKA